MLVNRPGTNCEDVRKEQHCRLARKPISLGSPWARSVEKNRGLSSCRRRTYSRQLFTRLWKMERLGAEQSRCQLLFSLHYGHRSVALCHILSLYHVFIRCRTYIAGAERTSANSPFECGIVTLKEGTHTRGARLHTPI